MGDQSSEVSDATGNNSLIGVELEPKEPRRSTRGKFLKWGTVLVVGASAGVGKLVSFTPTAAAADFNCRPIDPWNCDFGCTGVCSGFQSCCRHGISPEYYCCCTCYAGPYACQPRVFKARAYCSPILQCCCSTC